MKRFRTESPSSYFFINTSVCQKQFVSVFLLDVSFFKKICQDKINSENLSAGYVPMTNYLALTKCVLTSQIRSFIHNFIK